MSYKILASSAYQNGSKGHYQQSSQRQALPNDIDAEKALLGSILLHNDLFFDVSQIVSESDFFHVTHKKIYKAIEDSLSAGLAVDPITISDQIQIDDSLFYMMNLVNEYGDFLFADNHANIIRDKSLRRKLINEASKIATAAFDESNDIDEVAANAETQILSIQQTVKVSGPSTSKSVASDFLEHVEMLVNRKHGDILGLSSGLVELDRMLDGFLPQYYTIAGRPGMGKSVLLLNIADFMTLRLGKRGIFFALEMSKKQIMARRVARLSRLDLGKVKKPWTMNASEMARMMEATGSLSESDLLVDDTAGLTPSQIRSRAMKAHASKPLDFIMIDHFHLMRPDKPKSRKDLELSDMSQELSFLPKLFNCPVIQAAQLSRSVEQRQDKRPLLSDLRESGALEENSYAVTFVYRDEYYNPETTERPNIIELVTAKHRDGETGIVDAFWQGKTASIQNLHRERVDL